MCNRERGRLIEDFDTGDCGGVTICEDEGGEPAGQYGICLFGTGVEVRATFNVNAAPNGGGVGLCLSEGRC